MTLVFWRPEYMTRKIEEKKNIFTDFALEEQILLFL